MLRSAPLLLLLGAALLSAPGAARAQEEGRVRIRARSQLVLAEEGRGVLAGGRTAEVRLLLTLRDGPSGEPLKGQALALTLEGEPDGKGRAPRATQALRTGEDGQALATFSGLRAGRYGALARFAGDALRDSAQASLTLDLRRRGAQLSLSAPARAPLLGELAITVDLRDGDVPLPGPVALRVGVQPARLELREGRGRAALRLDPQALPGLRGGALVPVEASYAGDAFHDGRAERREVLVTTQVELALDAAPRGGDVAQGAALALRGEARDEDGPLGGESVELLALPEGARAGEAGPVPGERVLGAATVDRQGRFEVRLGRLELPLGPALVVASLTPARAHRLPARSEPLRLQVLAPEPVSLTYFLVPLALTALAIAAALLYRRRAWLGAHLGALLARLRPARAEAEPEDRAGELDPARAPQPGVTLRPRSTVQSILARPDFTIAGQVHDAAFGGPVLADVTVGGAEPLRCDERGRFLLPLLPPGRHEVEVQAEGYLPERFVAQLPHRGELRAVQVALLPIRARIMAAWREAAAPLLPPAEAATATPRELLRQVREALQAAAEGRSLQRRGAPLAAVPPLALGRLTDVVEETYYSGRQPDAAALREVEALCAEIRAAAPPKEPGRAGDGRQRAAPVPF